MASPLLQPTELAELLARPALAQPALRIFDVRPGSRGREAFERARLPGAQWADLDRDLAEIGDPARGGRHPLPEPEAFAATLARWGVGANDLVVAYDDQAGGNAAARLWWMVRSIGHDEARVLDGGIAAAVAAGIELETSPPTRPEPAMPITGPRWRWPLADSNEVAAATSDPRRLVLDVRSRERYLGLVEPFDPIAGHIPSAKNLPYTENLDAAGRFRSPDELRALYRDAFGDRVNDAIVHCGSGVTACHTLLAFEAAGLPRAKLFVGSWGEWCRSGRPMATGDEGDASSRGANRP